MKTYFGFSNYPAHRVACALMGDPLLHGFTLWAWVEAGAQRRKPRVTQNARAAVLLLPLLPARTPDGVRYTVKALKEYFDVTHPAQNKGF